jgi:hypothetical protein
MGIVEAFPGSFLGLLIESPQHLKTARSKRSDDFFVHLAGTGDLYSLLQYLLPDRQLATGFERVRNRDDRAALICALTALCVAANDYTVVGDEDGWIVLPPRSMIRDWGWRLLAENAREGGLEWHPSV